MKSKLFACLTMLVISISAMAQNVTYQGIVVGASDNEPVAGVAVTVKGSSTRYAFTDLDGNYALNATSGEVLVFTMMGYRELEVTLGENTVVNVALEDDTTLLEAAVAVGYGTMKKSDLAGASVSMKESDLKGSVITNLDQSLQGRAAGVSAVQTSGAPGSSSSIRVRGQATINANAEPLYVIDGVIIQGGGNSGSDFGLGDALGNGKVSTISPLSTINPSDIVSMEILKDASATDI